MRIQDIDLLLYEGGHGAAGTHGIDGAVRLVGALERRLGLSRQAVGQRPWRTPDNQLTYWPEWLADFRAALVPASAAWHRSLRGRRRLVAALPGRSVALASVAQVVMHHPRVRLIWIDAQANLDRPDVHTCGVEAATLAGLIGRWSSGFTGTLASEQIALIGLEGRAEPTEDRPDGLYVQEADAVDSARLGEWIGRSPVYIHLSCDVFVANDRPANQPAHRTGLTLDAVRRVLSAVAPHQVIGIEISGVASAGPDGQPVPTQRLADLVLSLVDG